MTINQLALSLFFISTAGFSCPGQMGDSILTDREKGNIMCMVPGTRSEPGLGGGGVRTISQGNRGGGSSTQCVPNMGQITTYFAGTRCGFSDIVVGNLALGEVKCDGSIEFVECVQL